MEVFRTVETLSLASVYRIPHRVVHTITVCKGDSCKECPQLTPNVLRVEEKHKHHKQRALSIHLLEKGENHLPSREMEARINKDI